MQIRLTQNPSRRQRPSKQPGITPNADTPKNKVWQQKGRKALMIALAAVLFTGIVTAGFLTMFGSVHAWVPLLAGFAGGIITYAFVAPEF